MKTALLSLFLCGVTTSAFALKQYKLQETLPNGNIQIRVIEEDETLRDQQNQISQQVIYNETFAPGHVPTHLELPLHTSELKLPLPAKPLWVPKQNAWTPADEDDYSAWFAQQTTDFDTTTGLNADCADVGLLFRWVYAHDHLLPIANTLDGSGKLFGHFSSSSAWDKLPQNADWKKDERFKAALRYLFDNTYTWSIVGDIYPTLVNPQYVRPGSMFMIIRSKGGHTQTIHAVDPKRGIITFWGNEPASEQIDQTGIIVEIDNKEKFGRWRTPALTTATTGATWILTPGNKMPGYSEEQFNQGFLNEDEFIDWFDQRLGVQESDEDRLEVLFQGFMQGISMRKNVTAQSEVYCYLAKCTASSQAYSDYSTFARDARLQSEQADMSKIIQRLPADNTTLKYVTDYLTRQGAVIPGVPSVTYLDLLKDPTALAKFNSDPRVSFAVRWGIESTPAIPTVDFYSQADALYIITMNRGEMVYRALDQCDFNCDPNSTIMQSLNTTKIDAAIQQVDAEVLSTLQSPGVDAAALPFVRDYFKKTSIPGYEGAYFYDDAIWADGAAERMKSWSPYAQDTIGKRWALPEPTPVPTGTPTQGSTPVPSGTPSPTPSQVQN